MKPHELVAALFAERKDITSVSALARAIHNQGFQGTLHKFLAGQVPHPTAATASRIAKFFQIPLEALYDSKVATRIARERGLLKGAELTVREPDVGVSYLASATNWPFRRITPTQFSNLSAAALLQLERVITAYIGGPLPTGVATADQYREIAHTLAKSMDRDLGKDIFVEFVLKVDELAAAGADRPAHALAS